MISLRIILAKLCRRNEISSYLQKYKNETIHKSKIINKALDFILENFTQIETCTDIADYLGVSSTHLSREFKSHLSIAPKKLLLTIKLAYSIQMMKSPGLKLFEISDLAGLGNLKRLNELCHKIFSTSPSNIRKSACNPKAIHFIELQLKHYLNCSKRVE
ncbi:helix-turn-helix domain-containing protein [candidate division KSB1 bacterium]|nr:helix-turn-helix domain-containing protein [candidate division KSB1 bacterium]